MKPTFLSGLFIFFYCFILCAQKQPIIIPDFARHSGLRPAKSEIRPLDLRPCSSHFYFIPEMKGLNASEDEIGKSVEKFLADSVYPVFQEGDMVLALKNHVTGPAGEHFSYIQLKEDIPVYNSQVKINSDKKGNIISCFINTYAVAQESGRNNAVTGNDGVKNIFPDDNIINTIISSRYKSPEIVTDFMVERIFFPVVEKNINGNGFAVKDLTPCILFTIHDASGLNYELVVNASGEILFERDLNSYFMPVDSTVAAKVFLPDPLTTAQVVYGCPYCDSDDDDIAELNNERKPVFMKVKYNAGIFSLENAWVKIADWDLPNVTPATSTIPVFDFTRNDDRFEDVNIYYHITAFHLHMAALGFSTLAGYQLLADAHALNGNDNSYYSNNSIRFGEGCVDDGEDADVIVHEYGHAVSESAAPGTLSGAERYAMEEGNSDYFASSYSRNLSEYGWERVFTWDGHNTCWPGRWTNSNTADKCYPANLTGDKYLDADIWSSTLMQIWEDIGGDTTDKILLQSLYGYATGMSMTDGANLFLQAADLLYNDTSLHNKILLRFQNRGFSGNCILSGMDEAIMPENGSELVVDNPAGDWLVIRFGGKFSGIITMADLQGKIIFSVPVHEQFVFLKTINNEYPGIYLIKIAGENFFQCKKLVKY